jgi:hypothetical protein
MAKRDLAYGVTRCSTIVIGAGLTGYSALLTWTHSHDISGPLAAVVGATLFVFGEAAWHNHRRARAVAFTALAILASGISGLAVLARTSSTADERIQVQRSANLREQKALDAAEAGVVATKAAASGECSSGRGPKCKGPRGSSHRSAQACRPGSGRVDPSRCAFRRRPRGETLDCVSARSVGGDNRTSDAGSAALVA